VFRGRRAGSRSVRALATPVAAREWLARLREHTAKPIRYLVLSHYHAVRVLGAGAFDADVIVAHEKTRALVAERGKQDWESPLSLPGRPDVRRLREVVRDGLTVLLAGREDHKPFERAARAVTGAPVAVLGLEGGAVADALGADPGDAWLIRPDAHIAAVLPEATPGRLAAAVRRTLGRA
jgi:hypothetical protein